MEASLCFVFGANRNGSFGGILLWFLPCIFSSWQLVDCTFDTPHSISYHFILLDSRFAACSHMYALAFETNCPFCDLSDRSNQHVSVLCYSVHLRIILVWTYLFLASIIFTFSSRKRQNKIVTLVVIWLGTVLCLSDVYRC